MLVVDPNQVDANNRPSQKDLGDYLLRVFKHSSSVEFWWHALGIKSVSSERPHDIQGDFSKVDPRVIKYLAREYESDDPTHFKTVVFPGIELHRRQYHHRMWNTLDQRASEDDLKAGASDTIVMKLEGRPYTKRPPYTYGEIIKEVEADSMKESQDRRNNPVQAHYLITMAGKMESMSQPRLELITSLHNFPNIGLSDAIYQETLRIIRETTRKYPSKGRPLPMRDMAA